RVGNSRAGERREARGERREARGERREARGERREARGERREARGERREARGERREYYLFAGTTPVNTFNTKGSINSLPAPNISKDEVRPSFPVAKRSSYPKGIARSVYVA
ncbi:hypothetical protein VIBR0546_01153, partial [Vibrio brasiliensis LMG 20546]